MLSLAACSSSIKRIDTDLEHKSTTADGTIGVKDDKVILQKESNPQDELRSVQWWNSKYEDDLNSQYTKLKWCREDLADPRLGGNGEVTPLPEIDNMKQVSDVKEQFGINQAGELTFVTREDYLKRIQIERTYQTTLTKMTKTVAAQKEECERKMGMARVKAGLPSKRYQSSSQMPAMNETSLDDAFKILEQQKAKKAAVSPAN